MVLSHMLLLQDNAVADTGLGHTSAAVVRQLDWFGPYPWKRSAAAEAEPARQPSTGRSAR